jgi:subtilisin family serine protease
MTMERRMTLGLLLTVLLLGLALLLPGWAGQAGYAPVDPDVWRALEVGGEAEVLVVLGRRADTGEVGRLPTKESRGQAVYEALRTAAQESQRGLRAMLEARGAEYRPFYLVNALQVRVDEGLLRLMASRPEVERILSNPAIRGVPDLPAEPLASRAVQGIEPNLQRVQADEVWALGATGQGVVVAGQDTGYDWDHPALISQYRGWDGGTADHDYNWHDAIHSGGGLCGSDSPAPCDDYGHGTHTMGILVGDDGAGHRIGMAPGAEWIGCRNMNAGVGTPATYIECFEFFLAPYPVGGDPGLDGAPDRAPDVVNNSWACPPSEGCDPEHTALMEESVEALRQAGIVVVVSAGNYGRLPSGLPACGSVKYPPAIYPGALSIGAFDHDNDRIAGFSSRGPASYDGMSYLKPDLTAPGVGILSSVPGGGYGLSGGTSMAAPHVAGGVALLLSAVPSYSGRVEAIEHLLRTTAEPVTTTETCGGDGPTDIPNHTWGWGILDALAAVETATGGTLQGTVTEPGTGMPLPGAQVMARSEAGPAGPTASTNQSGQYTMTLAPGEYDVTAQAWGFAPETITDVLVTSQTVRILDFTLTPLRRFYLPLIARD